MNHYVTHPDAPVTFTARAWGRHESGYGTPTRLVRNMFAMRVLVALTGPCDANGYYVCPIGREEDGTPVKFRLVKGEAEVDRPYEGDFYDVGNTCYVSMRGNQARNAQDFPDLARYRAAVLRVSLTLTLPTVREAKAWWPTRSEGVTRLGCNF